MSNRENEESQLIFIGEPPSDFHVVGGDKKASAQTIAQIEQRRALRDREERASAAEIPTAQPTAGESIAAYFARKSGK